MSLAKARVKAKSEFEAVALGGDPATEKKAGRMAGTFNELADLYIEIYAKPNKKSWGEDEIKINRYLRPEWGSRKANAITRRDVIRLLNSIMERGAPIQANRVLAVIRKMYSWGIGTDRVAMDVNPCHEVKKPGKETPRNRVLDAPEIKGFWPMAGADVKITEPSRLALRLILATAQRPGEVIGLPWVELDDDWETSADPYWTIPGERTKNGEPHRVPLSALAVSLLKEAKAVPKKKGSKADHSEWAFPSPRGGKPMLENSLSHALIRSGHFGLAHFVPHDLRRTTSTHMTGPHCGVSRFILDRVLNHVDPSVTGRHYDLYQYDVEKREALDAWASRLAQVIEGKEPEKVVPIHG